MAKIKSKIITIRGYILDDREVNSVISQAIVGRDHWGRPKALLFYKAIVNQRYQKRD